MTNETQKAGAVADKLLGKKLYQCEECEFGTDDVNKLHGVDDIHERVQEGEFMMSGICPECGSGIGCPDSVIPDYTLDQAVHVMRARGWKVEVTKP